MGVCRIFLVATLILMAGQALGAPVGLAMVTDLSGQASIVSHDRRSPAKILAQVAQGDSLEVGPSSQLNLIFFNGGDQVRLSGPCTGQVAASRIELKSGPTDNLVTTPCRHTKLNIPGKSLEHLGGALVSQDTRTGPPVASNWLPYQPGEASHGSFGKLLMPHALVGTPKFSWKPLPSLNPVTTVTVFGPIPVDFVTDLDPGELSSLPRVWSGTSRTATLTYTGPRLQPDKTYVWQARGQLQAASSFRILSETSQQEVSQARAVADGMRGQDPGAVAPFVMLMVIYAQHYLLEEAVEAGQHALDLRPDPGLRAALARIQQERTLPGKQQF